MRFSFTALALVALTTQTVVGDSWFGTAANTAYNKWHETELERWLSDHNVPYPAASDRKALQNLVGKNWENNVAKPYNSWDLNQLTSYLSSQGHEVKKGTEKNKESLLSQVTGLWHQTADQASESYGNVQDYIFNTWTESQLKSFLDHHGIPNPTPRTRDSLLQTARSNYQSVANKAGETANYPGDWIYQQWSDSDLKAWLDERGIPVPQPSSRDKLIASLRRNSHTASNSAAKAFSSVTSSAAAAQQSLSDSLIDSWKESDLKEWADKNGIPVPQGSKLQELRALARKNMKSLSAGNSASSASSYVGAATSSAGNQYVQATNDLYSKARGWYDYALNNIGFASAEAKSSISSVSASASSYAYSASSVASSSASSLASVASKSASSASKQAEKSGSNGLSAASSAASEVSKSVSASASSASKVASSSASSASKVAASSSSSAASVASASASSVSLKAKASSASGRAEL